MHKNTKQEPTLCVYSYRRRALQGVPAIPSKSYLHRAMICAALSVGRCRINGRVVSEDVASTMRALRALGCSVESEP